MGVPVGINTWSRHVTDLFPYLDQIIHPFDSIWFPDHVQYNGHNVSEGWTMAVYALARYPDILVGHDVLCNSFPQPGASGQDGGDGAGLLRRPGCDRDRRGLE